MIRLGLIGHPLGHSLSPKIHSAALKACNLEGSYSLFPTAPDDMQGLKDLLDRVRSGEITGLNVTIPHKQNVINFLDELTASAKAIGAVNTIYLRHKKVIGDNTDSPGFLTDLKRNFSHFSFHRSALILGAGGSARAVLHALVNDNWDVTIAARRIEQARQLANSFPDDKLLITNYENLPDNLQAPISSFSLIVNTTPLGMSPNTGQSPLTENTSLSKHTKIYDLVYNPRETKLVKDARAQGSSAMTGLGMLIEQAALSFELWTGCNPPREIMRASIE
ncbi:MAG TPA: shikimate dehydrogenase [Anaerolineales bacterium]|nr:shikimate dehydrogenase [Anaerolineales bacterium]